MNIHKPKPSSIVAIIVLIFFLTPLIWIGVCELNKARLDGFVDEMCQNNPWVVIIDNYDITHQEYLNLPRRGSGILDLDKNSGGPLYTTGKRTVLRESFSAKVLEHTVSIHHSESDQMLGFYKFYTRTGGDAPFTVSHPTSRSCDVSSNISGDGLETVFNIKG